MKRIHSKEEIIQIGLELILSNGFNATGVEAILKQAKIPKGSFYNFFSSKEEFCLKIIDKNCQKIFWKKNGGERGIRTLGTVARTTIFETVAFDHSAISP